MEELKHNFVLGRHKASRIANIHLDSEIYLVSNLAEEITNRLFIKSFNSLKVAFANDLNAKGKNQKF